LAVATAPAAADAQATNHLATPDSPAIVSINGPASSLGGRGFIDLTVEAYQPSPNGSIEAIVVARSCGRAKEIGRFGIFGRKAFDKASGDVAQHFSFPVPDGMILKPEMRLAVKLIARTGTIEGAKMRVGDAQHRF
jgi:hypothetical protein